MNPITSTLNDLGLVFQEFHHPPVFTCEEAEQLCPPMPGKKNKNLFLKNKKIYYLVSMTQDKRLDLKQLADKLGAQKLSFASEERLEEVLKIKPGSVGLLALLNDSLAQTQVYIDQDLLDEEWFQSHPGVNDITLAIMTSDIPQLLAHSGHSWQPINF